MKDDSALNGETGKEMFGGITTALDVDTGVSGGGSKTRRNKSAKNKRNKNAKNKRNKSSNKRKKSGKR